MRGSNSPLVSVVVPAFNAEATICETLASALAQTYHKLEVLIVDDGSSDATAGVVEEMMLSDPRLRLLRKPNGGLSSARNCGIAHAKGSLIAFLDADDLWSSEKISKQVEVFRRQGPAIGAVYTCFWPIDESGRIKDATRYVSFEEGEVYGALVLNNFVAPGSTLMVRREALLAVGGFDETLVMGCEDIDFCLRIAERYDFAAVPEFLVGYRQRAGSMSHKVREMEPAHERVIARARARHPELPDRLFRWSRARFAVHLGRALLRSGRPLEALPFLAKALLYDPALVLSLPYRSARVRLLAVFRGRQHRAGPYGRPYASAMSELSTAWLPRLPAHERRRRAYIATLKICSPRGPVASDDDRRAPSSSRSTSQAGAPPL